MKNAANRPFLSQKVDRGRAVFLSEVFKKRKAACARPFSGQLFLPRNGNFTSTAFFRARRFLDLSPTRSASFFRPSGRCAARAFSAKKIAAAAARTQNRVPKIPRRRGRIRRLRGNKAGQNALKNGLKKVERSLSCLLLNFSFRQSWNQRMLHLKLASSKVAFETSTVLFFHPNSFIINKLCKS